MLKADSIIIDDKEKLNKLFNYSEKIKSELFIFDVETDSKIPHTARLYGLGVCFDKYRAFYIPWKTSPEQSGEVGEYVWDEETRTIITKWIKNLAETKKLIGHNLVYDVIVCKYRLGLDLTDNIYSDTILLKHTIDEEPPFGLKECAVRDLGSWADEAQQDLKEEVITKGGKWIKDQKEMYLGSTATIGKYCCWDVSLTLLLFEKYNKILHEEGLEKLFYEEEVIPLYKHCTIPMKDKGFPVDLEHFNSLKDAMQIDLKKTKQKVTENIEKKVTYFTQKLLDKDAGIKSTGNFPKKLAEKLGIPLPVTKEGKITLAKKAIESQKEATPQFSDFYDWLLKTAPIPASEEIIKEVRVQTFCDKHESDYVFNIGSNDHLAEYFINYKGHKPTDFSEKTKKPKIDANFLEKLAESDDEAKDVLDFKRLKKIYSTYVIGILNRQLEGKIHSDMLQFGTTSGRYSSSNPNCLSMDTEILTSEGWVDSNNLHRTDDIACFNKEKKEIEFHTFIHKYGSEEKEHSMINLKSKNLDILVTENHRCLYEKVSNKKLIVQEAKEEIKEINIFNSYIYNNVGYTKYSNCSNFLRMIVMLQAIGSINKENTAYITMSMKKGLILNKVRKILEDNEHKNRFTYKEVMDNRGNTVITIVDTSKIIYNLLGDNNTFPSDWIMLPKDQREVVLSELMEWNTKTQSNFYFTNNIGNINVLQAMMCLNGWRGTLVRSTVKNYEYQLIITKRHYTTTNKLKQTKETINCKVWCVEVPTGFFIARRKGTVFITGNCQNLPRIKDEESGLSPLILKYTNAIRAGFIAPKGYKIVNADFSSLEPVCFSEMSGEEKIKDIFRKGHDLYSTVAIDVNNLHDEYSADKKAPNYLKELRPEVRQLWKVPTLGIVYGMEEARLRQAIGCSWKEANKIITDYKNTYPNLKKYMWKCDHDAITKGYVTTIFGRKRHLAFAQELEVLYGHKNLLDYKYAAKNGLLELRRKLKNLLNNAKNFRIQGLAAHIVNRAMIAIAIKLKEEKLDAYIALQVHDEITCIAREDQAERVAEIVQDCMENTIKISVPLVAEPLIADRWSDAK